MTSRLLPIKGRDTQVRRTLLRNLALIGLIAAAALFFVLSFAIKRSFSELEEREVQAHLARTDDFRKTSLDYLKARTLDWAVWDDTYFYTHDFNAGYVASNVNLESFKNAQVDGLAIVRYADGQARSYAFDRAADGEAPGLAKAILAIVSRANYTQHVRRHDDMRGFIVVNGRLYAVASSQIHRSDASGSPPGYLTFVQAITPAMASNALQVPVKIDVRSRISKTQIGMSANSIAMTLPLAGPDGKTVAGIHLQLPRPLTIAAEKLLLITFAGVFALIALLLLVLSRRVKTLVLDPVERLHRHVQRIRESGDLRSIDAPAPANEFGALQNEFNSMTAELQQLRSQLESQSFTLGKSQSAVGLMHNLRNSLSPVRVILEGLDRSCGEVLPAQAPRALTELAGDALDPARREKLVQFLAAAHERVVSSNAAARQQVREAARNLMNALDAIDAAAQNERETRFDERCDLSGIMSHSANIARFADHVQLAVDVQCDGYITVSGNRVLLSQVLENLVTNALEAIQDSGRQDGAISLAAVQDFENSQCKITVTDNGAGFSPDTATKLFERGFSTRTSKSGGLGLHWCANTVRAMNGALTLESDGKGTGARAIIRLPLWHDEELRNLDAA